jgi:hypothetical protein
MHPWHITTTFPLTSLALLHLKLSFLKVMEIVKSPLQPRTEKARHLRINII